MSNSKHNKKISPMRCNESVQFIHFVKFFWTPRSCLVTSQFKKINFGQPLRIGIKKVLFDDIIVFKNQLWSSLRIGMKSWACELLWGGLRSGLEQITKCGSKNPLHSQYQKKIPKYKCNYKYQKALGRL